MSVTETDSEDDARDMIDANPRNNYDGYMGELEALADAEGITTATASELYDAAVEEREDYLNLIADMVAAEFDDVVCSVEWAGPNRTEDRGPNIRVNREAGRDEPPEKLPMDDLTEFIDAISNLAVVSNHGDTFVRFR